MGDFETNLKELLTATGGAGGTSKPKSNQPATQKKVLI
jgi:hypothetical protein